MCVSLSFLASEESTVSNGSSASSTVKKADISASKSEVTANKQEDKVTKIKPHIYQNKIESDPNFFRGNFCIEVQNEQKKLSQKIFFQHKPLKIESWKANLFSAFYASF